MHKESIIQKKIMEYDAEKNSCIVVQKGKAVQGKRIVIQIMVI